MSRGKGAHAAPQGDAGAEARRAEREETRQVTRELHEAAQAAKEAAKELRSAQAAVWDDTQEMLNDLTREAQVALQQLVTRHTAELEQNHARLQDYMAAVEGNIRERFASFAGDYTPGSFRDLLIEQMTVLVNEELYHPEFQQGLARLMITLIEATSGGPGSLARAGRLQRAAYQAAQADGTEVFVRPAKPGEQPGFYEGYVP